MDNTWWVGEEQMDPQQKRVVLLPRDGKHFVTGPPGSGKTNLLLLRANFLYTDKLYEIAVIVFTKSLRQFLAAGSAHYNFPATKIQTHRAWQNDLLRQFGESPVIKGTFKQQREEAHGKLKALVESGKIPKTFDCILVDESQDYLPEELELFDALSNRLFFVADGRQRIYEGSDPIESIRKIAGEPIELKHHYRNGLAICKVADRIMKQEGPDCMEATSNYDEVANPSRVEYFRCKNFDGEIDLMLTKIDAQLKAYPNEVIGLACPKVDQVEHLWTRLMDTKFASQASLHRGSEQDEFDDNTPICVCTIHAIKGLEVRALHLLGCEALKKFGNNRNLSFTAATRPRTFLSAYFSADIHSYLEAALNCNSPKPEKPPKLADAFGRRK
ncbi:MAG TPA: AAA family ATPase [Lacipirellulaceae bacterium]|nr:AAA family ATPase [Lacipirellulaceae bacterium]HMP05210.1 AAA family ATPase [Lacipirellulaceae bacterium]